MNLKDKNIEELFRSELEDYEMPVDQSVWSSISNKLTHNVTTSTAATATSWLTYAGISTVAVAIGVVATLAYINNGTTQQKHQLTSLSNSNLSAVITQKEEIEKESTPARVITEDATFVNEIAKPSIVVNDPILPKDEQKSTSKKIIVVHTPETKAENAHNESYKKPSNSWVDTWLTSTSSSESSENSTSNNASDSRVEIKPNLGNCLQTLPMIVEVEKNEIIASIIAAPVGGYAPLEVSFAQQSEIGKVSWNFGDETSYSTETNPVHVFDKPGTYTVTLTIENDNGDIVTDTREIEVLANSSIKNIPNVITPNNDGNNDILTIETKNIETYQILIKDKKGNLIFESVDKDISWDGRNKYDEFVPAGNYVLILLAVGVDGKIYKQTSSVFVKY